MVVACGEPQPSPRSQRRLFTIISRSCASSSPGAPPPPGSSGRWAHGLKSTSSTLFIQGSRQLVVGQRVEVGQRRRRGQDAVRSLDLQLVGVAEQLGLQDLTDDRQQEHQREVQRSMSIEQHTERPPPPPHRAVSHRASGRHQHSQTHRPITITGDHPPVVEDVSDGPEAPGGYAPRARVATVHGPEHQVALVRVQLQQQHHRLAAQLVKRVVVFLGRDKTIQLLEELMCELELMEPVCSSVTHMDNPPYYRISASYKIPSVTTGTTYPHLDVYSGLNINLSRQHHRLESRYSSSSGGSYEEEKSDSMPLYEVYTVDLTYEDRRLRSRLGSLLTPAMLMRKWRMILRFLDQLSASVVQTFSISDQANSSPYCGPSPRSQRRLFTIISRSCASSSPGAPPPPGSSGRWAHGLKSTSSTLFIQGSR
ncbi:hypothetical protein CRUP_035007 [Coryphaenoides rupestris]|nr:hypothetical protein CRUP_035007 [Coryphaenoides rupestris]